MYFKEGNLFWECYLIKVVVYILKWYLYYIFDYFYLVVWFIYVKFIGMEYFMICFNFGCLESDGIYSECVKYGMIGVIIYEVGYNYFLMIVNFDEWQWIWMDEGLNFFLQYFVEQ